MMINSIHKFVLCGYHKYLVKLRHCLVFEQFYEKSGYDIMAQDDKSNAKSIQNMKDILKIAQNGKLWFK